MEGILLFGIGLGLGLFSMHVLWEKYATQGAEEKMYYLLHVAFGAGMILFLVVALTVLKYVYKPLTLREPAMLASVYISGVLLIGCFLLLSYVFPDNNLDKFESLADRHKWVDYVVLASGIFLLLSPVLILYKYFS